MIDGILVIGSCGLAKEILFSFPEFKSKFIFYDDVNNDNHFLFNKFKIIHNESIIKQVLGENYYFLVGVGTSKYREILYNKFLRSGGIPLKLISKRAKIGEYDNIIGEGTIVFDGTMITNSVKIGKGTLINKSVIISHDVKIGSFCDIAPSVRIMGNVSIDDKANIGTNAVIIPKIKIGKNVTIGAGTIVIRDVPDNSVVVGNPGKIIKELPMS